MESKKIFTKQMLMEECGVTKVKDDYFVRDVYKVKSKKRAIIKTKPSLMIQTFDKNDGSKGIHYIGLIVSLYNYKTKKYVSMSFAKLRMIWELGEVPMGQVIDHIDTNPLNNRLWNLRLLTEEENQKNRKVWKQFTLDEIKDKTVDELRQMISDRIFEELHKEIYENSKKQEQNIV